MKRDEAELIVRRVKAALADAGFDSNAWAAYDAAIGEWYVTGARFDRLPASAFWAANLLARQGTTSPLLTCWPCYEAASADPGVTRAQACEHDPWASERPRLERVR